MRCLRCGKIHESTETMQQVVAWNGKRKLWVCRDEMTCWDKRRLPHATLCLQVRSVPV